MTGEKKSSDLSNRLSVKRGGKLISKTLGKTSLPPSICAPPKAAVGASKVKQDEVQLRKNSFHDMLHASTKEKDGERTASLDVLGPASRPAESGSGSSLVQVPTTPGNNLAKDLEKALAAAQAETATLRQELEMMRQDAQASVEIFKHRAPDAQHQPGQNITINHFQHAEEGNIETHNHDRELHYPPIAREEDLANQNLDLRYCLAELQDQLLVQATRQPPEAMHSESDWNALTLRLHESEKESHSRLQQLLSLKSSISSLTRTDLQVADNELAELFSQLANRVREWVVSNYRRTKMNLVDVPLATTEMLISIKSDYKKISGAEKLALYQAIVSRTLMSIFDAPVVVGMPAWGMYGGVQEFSAKMQNAGAEFHEWKRATLRLIEKHQCETAFPAGREEDLEVLADKLNRILLSITSTKLTSSAQTALIGILTAAAELQRTLCLQKAQYRISFFDTIEREEHHFNSCTMEPVNDLEYTIDEGSSQPSKQKFVFCVFPCLEKLGDGTGADTYMDNVVFKARVSCGFG